MIVRYRSYKWPDRLHWHYDTVRLGEDEHGTWLWVTPGTVCHRGEGDDRYQTVATWGFVELIHRTAWYSAEFYPGGETQVYVDINTPAVWDGPLVTMIDLDLDVVRKRSDGSVTVLDEDEFEQHRVEYDYPEHLVTGAREAVTAVVGSLVDGRAPFGAVGDRWLERAQAPGHRG